MNSFISDVGGIIGLLFGMSVIGAYDWLVEKAKEIGFRKKFVLSNRHVKVRNLTERKNFA